MSEEIVKINGGQIECPYENGQHYVAIRPICQILGIDDKSQRNRIKSDAILSSTEVVLTSVGADGKQREMVCIPVRYVFGWLFSIDETKAAPEAKDALIRYRRECYDALYDHFYMSAEAYQRKENKLKEDRETIARLEDEKRAIDQRLKEAKQSFQETMEKPVAAFRQLELF